MLAMEAMAASFTNSETTYEFRGHGSGSHYNKDVSGIDS